MAYHAVFDNSFPLELTILEYYPTELRAGENLSIIWESKRLDSGCTVTFSRFAESLSTPRPLTYKLGKGETFINEEVSVEAAVEVETLAHMIPGKYEYYSILSAYCSPYNHIFGPVKYDTRNSARSSPIIFTIIK